MTNLFSLDGKTSIITGGSGLIGKSIVDVLLHLKSKVINIDINNIENIDNDLYFFEKIDLTDIENLPQVILDIVNKYGSIDTWINNAYPRTADWGNKLEDVSVKSWQKNIDMQLNSYCILSNEIAKAMSINNKGSIINIASIQALVAPDFKVYDDTDMTSPAAYTAIKGGISMYTKYIASYFGNRGVRANVVCPGGVFNYQHKEFLKRYNDRTLLGRMANPEEIAWPVAFLASDAASYVTGSILTVDGGLTAI